MSDATTVVERDTFATPKPQKIAVVLKNAITAYPGTFLLRYTASYATTADRGYADVTFADSANIAFLGMVVSDGIDNAAGLVGDGTKKVASVSGFRLRNVAVVGAASIVDNDKPVYLSDNQTLTLSSTSNLNAIGHVVKWITSTTCDVYIMSFEEYKKTTT